MVEENNNVKSIGSFLIKLGIALIGMIAMDQFLFSESVLSFMFKRSWDLKSTLMGFAIFVGLITTIVYFSAKGEDRKSLREGMTRAWMDMLQKIKSTRIGAKILGEIIEYKDPELQGELEQVFKDLRLDIYHLMNVMLRHEIYNSKMGTTHHLFEEIKQAEETLSDRLPTIEDINDNMQKFLHGAEIIKTAKGWELKAEDDDSGEKGGGMGEKKGIGFARSYYLILTIMSKYKELLEQDLTKHPSELKLDGHGLGEIRDSFSKDIQPQIANMEKYYDRYKTAIRRYKAANHIRVQRLFFLDMYNMYGSRRRGHAFAKVYAVPDYYDYELDGVNYNEGATKEAAENKAQQAIRSIDWSTVEPVIKDKGEREKDYKKRKEDAIKHPNFEHGHSPWLLEVDIYGFCISDVNDIQTKGKNLHKRLRRFRKEDQTILPKPTQKEYKWEVVHDSSKKEGEEQKIEYSHIPRYHEVLESAYKEWQGYMKDLEQGVYHPYSRSTKDYQTRILKGWLKFDDVPFTKILSRDQDVAYDREALKVPGMFRYWGRRDYTDHDVTSIREYPANPYPMASMLGIWAFIKAVSVKRLGENRADKFLPHFKMNYSDVEKVPGKEAGGSKDGHH